MHFADQSGQVALLAEERWRRLDVVKDDEMVLFAGKPILSVLVGV
jgi:hypothetical protein